MTHRAGIAPKDQPTFWQGNTPLMLAVKHQQLETIKQLITVYKADTEVKNFSNKTANDIASSGIKDPNVFETVTKLLKKQTQSTKVAYNKERIEEKKQMQANKENHIKALRDALKSKLQEQGINITETFSRFDRNGDGVFSHMEFEMIFTVLDISFTKEELRKLISLTDTNRDGKIDVAEFHKMLYSDDLAAAKANQAALEEDEDISIVEEVSHESGDENNIDSDEEIKRDITTRMEQHHAAKKADAEKKKTKKRSDNEEDNQIQEDVIEDDMPIGDEPIEEESVPKNINDEGF